MLHLALLRVRVSDTGVPLQGLAALLLPAVLGPLFCRSWGGFSVGGQTSSAFPFA